MNNAECCDHGTDCDCPCLACKHACAKDQTNLATGEGRARDKADRGAGQ